MSRLAWFEVYPKSIRDLQVNLRQEDLYPYVIVDKIVLRSIFYNNFIYGMDVEREYLEKLAPKCSRGQTYQCVLVKKEGKESGGILVVPNQKGVTVLAAMLDRSVP